MLGLGVLAGMTLMFIILLIGRAIKRIGKEKPLDNMPILQQPPTQAGPQTSIEINEDPEQDKQEIHLPPVRFSSVNRNVEQVMTPDLEQAEQERFATPRQSPEFARPSVAGWLRSPLPVDSFRTGVTPAN